MANWSRERTESDMQAFGFPRASVYYDNNKSGARMPLICGVGGTPCIAANFTGLEQGLADMAGLSYQDAPEAISGEDMGQE